MAASDFIDDLQNVITEYMKSSSFSVGISDLIANKTTQDSIIQVITSQKQEVQSLIEKLHLGIFENNTASSNMMEFENKVNNILLQIKLPCPANDLQSSLKINEIEIAI